MSAPLAQPGDNGDKADNTPKPNAGTGIIKKKCSFCGKLAVQVSTSDFGDVVCIQLECGHAIMRDKLAPADPDEIVSEDGRMLFDYQKKSVEFVEAAGGSAIIAHEMGLGKTVIELALLLRNKQKMLPALIIVKSGLRLQWLAECVRWVGIVPQVIMTSKEKPYFSHFKIIIVSIDMVRALNWSEEICSKFKSVTIDECQLMKNSTSQRTKAIRKLFSKVPHRRGLSGTPIKNNAGEYFPILNFINNEQFPSEARFLREDVVWDGYKAHGLRYPKLFAEKTKSWIIRYLREEVLPDLPPVFRTFRKVEMEDGLKAAYEEVVKDFLNYMDGLDEQPNWGSQNILGYFAQMRHIIGISKAQDAVDYAEEFLLSTNRKLTIFVHHKKVGEMIMAKLSQTLKDSGYEPAAGIFSEMDVQTRQDNVEKFRTAGCRILVASTLAAGEGLNLQFCSDCLITERQWNPANEEQAEARFPRPGTELKRSEGGKINAAYLVAIGTMDEWLTQLVEKKRSIVQQTLDGKTVPWAEQSLFKELYEIIRSKGRDNIVR
jgi:SNF2 family DNA or RNA helicase